MGHSIILSHLASGHFHCLYSDCPFSLIFLFVPPNSVSVKTNKHILGSQVHNSSLLWMEEIFIRTICNGNLPQFCLSEVFFNSLKRFEKSLANSNHYFHFISHCPFCTWSSLTNFKKYYMVYINYIFIGFSTHYYN